MRSLLIFAIFSLLTTGCVERILSVQSNPPGAVVHFNDQEIGRTPLHKQFVWYGNYDVQVRRDGYETLTTKTWVSPPWWQWPVIDLIPDLLPFKFVDEHQLTYDLKPQIAQDTNRILDRAMTARGQLESSRQATTTHIKK